MNDRRQTESGPGVPRWVKVSGIVVLLLALLVVVAMLVLGGEHGPGRHMGLSGSGGSVSAASTPLAGGHE